MNQEPRPEGGTSAEAVTGIVITHGHNPLTEASIASVAAQTERTLVVANIAVARPEAADLPNVTYVENDEPATFAANVNRAVERVDTPYAAVVNPDAIADPGCIPTLVSFLSSRIQVAVAAPQLRWPDGRPQPTGRSFPAVGETIVRRTPLRLLYAPFEEQGRHYRLDASPDAPWIADWLLGAFWVLRTDVFDQLGGMDTGYPMYVEDMDFCVRARRAGWECWVVPEASAVHEYQAVIDARFLSRRNWWHLRGMARFVRRYPGQVLVPAFLRARPSG